MQLLTTPNNFIISSVQGAVQLTWTASPFATSYTVYRSSNGVTFASIGTTALTTFLDSVNTMTPTVVNTVYYYYIIATASGYTSSQPTPTYTAQPLLPGQTTLGNLNLLIRQECDRVNSNYVTDQEINSYISNSYKELYDIVVQKFGNDYYLAIPYTYTTSGTINAPFNASVYPLPPDFYKSLLVEVALNPADPNSWVTLKKFERIQQNLWNFPNVYTFYGLTNLRYRLTAQYLQLVPIPSAGQTVRLWYAPRPSQLLMPTDLVDGISGWEEYIVADVCIKVLRKEESATQDFKDAKQALLKRIEEAAENRDIGEPETVSDTRTRNFAWSDDTGGWPNGGLF